MTSHPAVQAGPPSSQEFFITQKCTLGLETVCLRLIDYHTPSLLTMLCTVYTTDTVSCYGWLKGQCPLNPSMHCQLAMNFIETPVYKILPQQRKHIGEHAQASTYVHPHHDLLTRRIRPLIKTFKVKKILIFVTSCGMSVLLIYPRFTRTCIHT